MLIGFIMHIGGGVHMYQETNTGNYQEKQGGQLVCKKGEGNINFIIADKIKQVYYLCITFPDFHKNQEAHYKGSQDHTTANNTNQGFSHRLSS